MNAKERTIIEALIDKSDKFRHQVALDILFGGRNCHRENNVYSLAVKNAVQKVFSGWRYNCFKDGEVYDTFLSFFVPYIESVDAEVLRSIEDLKGWLFHEAYNSANMNRQKINEALGINDEDGPKDLVDDGQMKEEGGQEEAVGMGFNNDGEAEIEWYENLVKLHIDKLPNERDRWIVESIMLKGRDRKELAAELGITLQDLNHAYEKAWIRVLNGMLLDSRYRAKMNFLMYESEMLPCDAMILRRFFTGDFDSTKQITKMALEANCPIDTMETMVKDAHKRLIIIQKAAERKEHANKQGEWSANEKAVVFCKCKSRK